MQVFQVGYDVKVNCAENTLFIAVRRSIGTSGSNAKTATCTDVAISICGMNPGSFLAYNVCEQHTRLQDSTHVHGQQKP